jgi:FMN reductase
VLIVKFGRTFEEAVVLTVVVGNPKPQSRTLEASVLLAESLTGRSPDHVIDVVELGSGLLTWGDAAVAEAVATVCASQVCIVASPTFKATYTGLLKLFLDQFPAGALEGVTVFPLMLGAGAAHAMAPEVFLKPVLVELGATCPVAGLYLLDSSYRAGDARAAWIARATRHLPAQ